jgi:hypothetical protein
MMKIRLFLNLLCVLVLLSCQNPFSTRKAEPPDLSENRWIQPYSPDLVLANLVNAIADHSADHFVRCLSSGSGDQTFQFIPDPQAANVYPGAFDAWDLNRERTAAREVFAWAPADSMYQLSFIEDVFETLSADSAVFIKRYRLEIHHGRPSTPNLFEGRMDLRLAPIGGEWFIVRWSDHAESDMPSWSRLKAMAGG